MGQTAIISPQIVDSSQIGRDLITAADQAAAQAIIGVTGVDTSADYTWTGDHTFDGSATFTDTFDAVDGDFSGTVTAASISAVNSAFFLDQSVATGSIRTRFGGVQYFYHDRGAFRGVNDNQVNLGSDSIRFKNVYSYDGSFTGNLVNEVGGSYKLYNLGDASAADSEYLGITFDANTAKIQSNTTGSGVTRNINVKSGSNYLQLNSSNSTALIGTAASQLLISNTYFRFNKTIYGSTPAVELGTASYRFGNTYSVDGNFSGNLVSEVGGSIRAYQLGTDGDADTRYIEYSDYGIRQVKTGTAGNSAWYIGSNTTGAGIDFIANGLSMIIESNYGQNIRIADGYNMIGQGTWPRLNNTIPLGIDANRWSNVASVNGSFSGSLVSEVGGAYRVYNLGTDGDADTEYFDITWQGNNLKIKSQSTGAGVERRIDFEGSASRFISAGITICDIGSGDLRLYSNRTIRPLLDNQASVGKTSHRFTNVYSYNGDFATKVTSVDGSFSGNLVSEVGGSYKLYNLGTEGDADTEYLDISWTGNEAYIFPQHTGTGVGRAMRIGSGTTYLKMFHDSTIQYYRAGSVRMAIGATVTQFYGNASFDSNMTLSNLPTSDPAVAGQLWNDSGTVKISAG